MVARARPPRRPSRGTWIAAALVGVICLVAAAFVWLSEPAPVAKPQATSPPPRSGFATGLVVGLAAGFAIGFAIARRARRDQSSGSGSEYSSRNSP